MTSSNSRSSSINSITANGDSGRCVSSWQWKSFFVALWRCALDGPPHEFYGWEVEDWLCGIGQAAESLSPYLDLWLTANSENGRLNLARFITETDFGDSDPRPTAYWEGRAESFEQVAVWVRSDEVKVRIAGLAAEFPQYDFVERAHAFLP